MTGDLEVPNFRHAPFGMLVTYSDHWYKEHCQKPKRTPKIGVMTGTEFYMDGNSRVGQ